MAVMLVEGWNGCCRGYELERVENGTQATDYRSPHALSVTVFVCLCRLDGSGLSQVFPCLHGSSAVQRPIYVYILLSIFEKPIYESYRGTSVARQGQLL